MGKQNLLGGLMITPSTAQFGKALINAGLMKADEVQAVLRELADSGEPKDSVALAALLVKQGRLTEYQGREILEGRAADLVMGDYLILDHVGAGGMGQVLKAEHRTMGRIVALKIMSASAMKDEAAIKRFQREVRAAARLEHENIVTAHAAGEARGMHYLVMQYVEGNDLSGRVKKEGPLSVDLAMDCICQAARGLAYAHEEGVIHRDIKPANLLLDKKGVVKILDMGLARIDDGGSADGLTGTEQVLGTVDYMSPEQSESTRNCDARADIYSLGCTLWYLLTGTKAYVGETAVQRIMAHRDAPLPSLLKTRDDVPWALEKLFHRMIAKRAEDRCQTMGEVVRELEQIRGVPESSRTNALDEDTQLGNFFKTLDKQEPARPATKVKAAAGQTSAPDEQTLDHGDSVKVAGKSAGKHPHAKNAKVLIAAGAAGLLVLLLGVFIYLRSTNQQGAEVVRKETPPGQTAKGTKTKVVTTVGPGIATPQTTVPQPSGFALDLGPERQSYVEVPEWKYDGKTPLTVEAWVMTRNKGGADVIGRPDPDDKSPTLSLMRAGSGRWRFTLVQSKIVESNESSNGDLVHLAGVFNGSQIAFYVNGQKQNKTTSAQQQAGEQSVHMFIGARFRPKSNKLDAFFDGMIDEVRISSVARYTSDFTPQQRFEPDAATEVLYHFDEGTGTVAKDSSLHQRDGKIVGAIYVAGALRVPSAPVLVQSEGTRKVYATLSQTEILTSPDYEWTEPEKFGFAAGGTVVSGDGLTAVSVGYAPKKNEQGESQNDLWIRERASLDEPFGKRTALEPSINSNSQEAGPWLSVDGLTLLFGTNRPGVYSKSSDLWQATRKSRSDPFANAASLGEAVNAEGPVYGGTLSADGLVLVLETLRKGGVGGHDFWQCRRKDLQTPFGVPENLGPAVNSTLDEQRPWLSSDGRVLLFDTSELAKDSSGKSTRVANSGTLWMTVRPSIDAPFGSRQKLPPPINREGVDNGTASITTDGKLLVFCSQRAADGSRQDVWLSRRVPKPGASSGFALDFSPERQSYVEVPEWKYDGTTPLTIEAWVRPKHTGATVSMISCTEGGGWGLFLRSRRLNFKLQGKNDYTNVDSDAVVATERLLHVAAVFDGRQCSLFADGRMQSQNALVELPYKRSAMPILIGAEPSSVRAPDQFFDGTIDEVRISSVVRYKSDFTPEQRIEPDDKTVVLYHFDEGTGAVAKDSSSHHRDGKIVGATYVAGTLRVPSAPALQSDATRSVPATLSQTDILTSADYRWSDAENLGPINSSAWDSQPAISGDGLTLVFNSTRSGSLGLGDLWIAECTTIDEPFRKPVNLGPTINSAEEEYNPWISPDALLLVFVSKRDTVGRNQLYTSGRRSRSEPFGAPSLWGVANSDKGEYGGLLSADGLTLLISSSRAGGGRGGMDFWYATRTDREANFGELKNLGPPVNTAQDERSPWLSADGRVLLFHRSTKVDGKDACTGVFMAVRPAPSEPFGEPVMLPPPISPDGDAYNEHPSVTADGRLLFFGSNRTTGSHGNRDIWMVRRVPKPGTVAAFNGHRYMWVQGEIIWDDAKKRAEEMGGHLVTITSADENAWLKENLLSRLPQEKMAWIGASHQAKSDPWSWITGEPFDFNDWQGGDVSRANAAAGIIRRSRDRTFHWAAWESSGRVTASSGDTQGEGRNVGFIVEWDGPADQAGLAPDFNLERNGITTERELADWTVRVGGFVNVGPSGSTTAAATAEQIAAKDFKLTAVRYDNVKTIDDEALANMVRWPLPAQIGLEGTAITDAGLRQLAALKHDTRSLGLVSTKITGAGFDAFAGRAVSILNLGGCPISREGWTHLGELKSISSLYVGGTKLSDETLAALVNRQPNLLILDVFGNPITDAALEPVSRMPRLERLYIYNTGITDAGLAHLEKIKTLVSLRASATKITAAGVARLQEALPNCKIEWDGDAKPESEKPTATNPQSPIPNPQSPDRAVAEWVISKHGVVRPAGAKLNIDATNQLPSGSFELEFISLSRGSKTPIKADTISEDDLQPLLALKSLKSLNLNAQPSLGDTAAKTLARIATLESLQLATTQVGDEGCKALVDLSNLRSLQLTATTVSDAGLEHLAKLKKLTTFHVGGVKITATGVAKLQKALPDCKIEWDGALAK